MATGIIRIQGSQEPSIFIQDFVNQHRKAKGMSLQSSMCAQIAATRAPINSPAHNVTPPYSRQHVALHGSFKRFIQTFALVFQRQAVLQHRLSFQVTLGTSSCLRKCSEAITATARLL
jgi:hypothetical protein